DGGGGGACAAPEQGAEVARGGRPAGDGLAQGGRGRGRGVDERADFEPAGRRPVDDGPVGASAPAALSTPGAERWPGASSRARSSRTRRGERAGGDAADALERDGAVESGDDEQRARRADGDYGRADGYVRRLVEHGQHNPGLRLVA